MTRLASKYNDKFQLKKDNMGFDVKAKAHLHLCNTSSMKLSTGSSNLGRLYKTQVRSMKHASKNLYLVINHTNTMHTGSRLC